MHETDPASMTGTDTTSFGQPSPENPPPQTAVPLRYVAAAARTFAKFGYSGTALRDIGEEASISQPRISQLFGGKLPAFLAAHDHVNRLIATELLASSPTLHPIGFRQDACVDALGHLAANRPEVPLMIVRASTAAISTSAIAEAQQHWIRRLAHILISNLGASHAQAHHFLLHAYLHGSFRTAAPAARYIGEMADG